MLPHRTLKPAVALALTSLAVGIVIAVPPAAAQCAACDQYVPPGHQQHGPGPPRGGSGGGGGGNASGIPGPGAVPGPGFSAKGARPSGNGPSGASLASSPPGASERGGASIPIVDYPATPLVWALIIACLVAILGSAAALGRRSLQGRRRSTA